MKQLFEKVIRSLRTVFTYGQRHAFSNVAVGTHQGRLTRTLEAATTERYVLVKAGVAAATAAVAGVADQPLGVLTDTGNAGDAVNINLLTYGSQTQLLLSAGAISAGDMLYLAANGRVQKMPSTPGIYYEVGMALTAAASAGQVVEASTFAPRRTAVIAAFTGNAANDVGSLGLALESAPDKVRVLAI